MAHGSRIVLALAVVAAGGLLLPPAGEAQVALGVGRVRHVQVTTSPSTNCTNLRQVLAGITDAASARRYLVKLPPGDFICGNQPILVKAWVTLEGSGHLTSISGTPGLLGVVNLDDRSELRSLRVSGFGTNSTTAAIVVFAIDHAIDTRIFEVYASGTASGAGDSYALLISAPSGTDVEIDRSELFGFTAAVSVGANTEVQARFSILNCGGLACSVTGSGGAECVASYRNTSPLDGFCG